MFTPLIKRPCLHKWPFFTRECTFNNFILLDSREFISRGPVFRDIFRTKINGSLFESFKFRLPIAIKLYADTIKIILSAINWKIFSPIIVNPIIFNKLTENEIANPISAPAPNRLSGGPLKILVIKVIFRKNRQCHRVEYRLWLTFRKAHANVALVLLTQFQCR